MKVEISWGVVLRAPEFGHCWTNHERKGMVAPFELLCALSSLVAASCASVSGLLICNMRANMVRGQAGRKEKATPSMGFSETWLALVGNSNAFSLVYI
jgi:hypothetical protein